MPNYLKFTISLIVAAIAALAFYSGVKASGVIIGLAAGMVAGIWLFPEAKRQGPSSG